MKPIGLNAVNRPMFALKVLKSYFSDKNSACYLSYICET